MAVLKVIEWPEKVLETKAESVEKFDDKLRSFVADMHETMTSTHGIGLAANQVNVLQRVLTIHIPFEGNRYEDSEEAEEQADESSKSWWHDKRFTIINPVITKKVGKARYMEGCLSFPEIYDYVDRADKVSITAQDEFGKELKIDADGLFSICIQHEIDHLDGIVFINRMSRLKAKMIKKKIQKRHLVNS